MRECGKGGKPLIYVISQINVIDNLVEPTKINVWNASCTEKSAASSNRYPFRTGTLLPGTKILFCRIRTDKMMFVTPSVLIICARRNKSLMMISMICIVLKVLRTLISMKMVKQTSRIMKLTLVSSKT